MKAGALRCGQLAELAGVSADTIRHYERIGVLAKSPRTAAGYRMYSPDAVGRVRLVQAALQLGFTLSELSEILKMRDNGNVPCHRVLSLTEEKLRSLGKQIEELQRTQTYMRKVVRQWKAKLAKTEPGQKAMLLHSLATTSLRRRPGQRNLRRRKQA